MNNLPTDALANRWHAAKSSGAYEDLREAGNAILDALLQPRGTEPSEAQVLAALDVYDPLFPRGDNEYLPRQIELMRAALRTVFKVPPSTPDSLGL